MTYYDDHGDPISPADLARDVLDREQQAKFAHTEKRGRAYQPPRPVAPVLDAHLPRMDEEGWHL